MNAITIAVAISVAIVRTQPTCSSSNPILEKNQIYNRKHSKNTKTTNSE